MSQDRLLVENKMAKESSRLGFFIIIILIAGAVWIILSGGSGKISPGEDIEYSIDSRDYLVYVPEGYDEDKETPVVLALHGAGSNKEGFQSTSKLADKADEEGFILVFPDGTGEKILGVLLATWNAGVCCESETDDVLFISQVLDKVEQDYNVNTDKIYVTGHSNGAQMSYRLACELSDRISAIAPYGAVNNFDYLPNCNPTKSIPTIHIQSSEDPCVPYEGGTCGGCIAEIFGAEPTLWPCESAPNYIEQWKAINAGADVQLITITGGHMWPQGTYGDTCEGKNTTFCNKYREVVGPINQDVNINKLIWNFFESH